MLSWSLTLQIAVLWNSTADASAKINCMGTSSILIPDTSHSILGTFLRIVLEYSLIVVCGSMQGERNI